MADKKYVSKLTFGDKEYFVKDLEAQAAAVHVEEKTLTDEEAKTLLKKYVLVNADGEEVKTSITDPDTGDVTEEVVYIEVPKDKVIESGELYVAATVPEEPEEPSEPTAPVEPDPIDEDTATEDEKTAYAEAMATYNAALAVYNTAHTAWETAHAEWETAHTAWETASASAEAQKALDEAAGLEEGKTYIKVTVANQDDPIYIPVESLVESQEAVYDETEESIEFVGFKFNTL